MTSAGRVNPQWTLEAQGITTASAHYNQLAPALVTRAIANGEGELGHGGAFLCTTDKFTGRSPSDKFIVRTQAVEENIWWDNNQPMEPAAWARLKADMFEHAKSCHVHVQDLHAGADPAHRLRTRMITGLAWHALFVRHLLRRPSRDELMTFEPEWTVLNLPTFRADPARHGCRSDTVIALNMDERMVLIANTAYAGENKKSIFTVLNYILPDRGVMPMHCSANHAPGDPDDTAIFFGLSGTGKTTLSADAARILIGDDEHGWSDDGVFNFEGGCYAKTINLSPEAEPEIYATTSRFATVIENMVYDPETLAIDFADTSLTRNTRCAYPLEYIPNASLTGRGGQPRNIIMLTCDTFGVLPPIARLSPPQAVYHFLSGFTAKIAGTERGITEPVPTFSTCFGAPFMPRHPEVYGRILQRRMARAGADCWLVNTGWTGGRHGVGRRMPIAATRALLAAALNGTLARAEFRRDANFGFEVPIAVPGVDPALLDPRGTWPDADAHDAQARVLTGMFAANFARYLPRVDAAVREVAIG